MRIIHGQGYTAKDRAEFKELVYKNVFKAIEILVEAMRVLKISYESPTNQVSVGVFGVLTVCRLYRPMVRSWRCLLRQRCSR